MCWKAAVVIAFLFVLLVASLRFFGEPFLAYKSPIPKPKTQQPLKYSQPIDDVINETLKLELSLREKAIILGMRWAIHFADKDTNFNFIFPYYILFLHEMTFSEDRVHQREIAQLAMRMSLARAQVKLAKLYPKNEDGRWKLIAILHILLKYPEYKTPFLDFFREHFAHYPSTYTPSEGVGFSAAIQTQNYQIMGDYLINTSFLHYYLAKTKEPELALPANFFPEYLKKLEKFDYDLTHQTGDNNFMESAFLATHVVLILTNYGEFPIKDDINKRKAQAYLEATFDQVSNEVGNLDLLAEYVQSLKILNPGKDPRIAGLEKLLFGLQRADGSWGSLQDFNSNPYDAFHPTWSVLTAINHPNTRRQEHAQIRAN